MFLFSPFFHRLCSTLVAFFALLDLFVCFVVFFSSCCSTEESCVCVFSFTFFIVWLRPTDQDFVFTFLQTSWVARLKRCCLLSIHYLLLLTSRLACELIRNFQLIMVTKNSRRRFCCCRSSHNTEEFSELLAMILLRRSSSCPVRHSPMILGVVSCSSRTLPYHLRERASSRSEEVRVAIPHQQPCGEKNNNNLVATTGRPPAYVNHSA